MQQITLTLRKRATRNNYILPGHRHFLTNGCNFMGLILHFLPLEQRGKLGGTDWRSRDLVRLCTAASERLHSSRGVADGPCASGSKCLQCTGYNPMEIRTNWQCWEFVSRFLIKRHLAKMVTALCYGSGEDWRTLLLI